MLPKQLKNQKERLPKKKENKLSSNKQNQRLKLNQAKLFYLTTIYANITGSISGLIIDADTHQPLVGANIIIVGSDFGGTSDIEGKFKNIDFFLSINTDS